MDIFFVHVQPFLYILEAALTVKKKTLVLIKNQDVHTKKKLSMFCK